MKNIITVLSILIFFISCASLPHSSSDLEGGDVRLVTNGVSESALEELRKIDLVYELDPKKHGSCNEKSFKDKNILKPEKIPVSFTTQKLKCAFEGFYSRKYFNALTDEDKKSLEVNNVTLAYAEKHAQRILKLAKQFDDSSIASQKEYYKTLSLDVQEIVIGTQLKDFKSRMVASQESSSFLEFQRRKRNHVQSNFISASDAACDIYKRNLNSVYSSANFGFGSFATLTGGLGAVLTNTNAARALSGISGITSGIRAEYNDAFFRNKVVELLTKAMDIALERKKGEIRRRSTQIIGDYSMEDAISDAILYNSYCSLVAGLQETSESLQTVSDPGLKWLANAFGGAASNEKLTNELFKSLGKTVNTIQQIQKATEDQNSVIESNDSNVQ